MGRSALIGALVLLFVVTGCSAEGGGSGDEASAVERVTASGHPPTGGIAQVGDLLIGPRILQHDHVVASRDGGRTWEPFVLPDSPPELAFSGMVVHGGAAVLVGRNRASVSPTLPVAAPEVFAWTSTDGTSWTRHVFPTDGGASDPVVSTAGARVVLSAPGEQSHRVYTSADRGRTWRLAAVRATTATHDELARPEAGELRALLRSGDGLLRSRDGGDSWDVVSCNGWCPLVGDGIAAAGDRTSVDGGRTWHDVEIEPSPPGMDPSILSVDAVPDGWLATSSTYVPSDVSYGQLLRSTDGRRWRQALPSDPCDATDLGRPNSDVGEPVRVGDRWYVTYDCTALISPAFGMVYESGPEAEDFRLVEGSRRDGIAFGRPVVDGDSLLIPELAENAAEGHRLELSGILRLDPPKSRGS